MPWVPAFHPCKGGGTRQIHKITSEWDSRKGRRRLREGEGGGGAKVDVVFGKGGGRRDVEFFGLPRLYTDFGARTCTDFSWGI